MKEIIFIIMPAYSNSRIGRVFTGYLGKKLMILIFNYFLEIIMAEYIVKQPVLIIQFFYLTEANRP